MNTLDELYEKAIKGELKPVETKANIFETLEGPKTATELSNNSFIPSKDYTREQIIDIIDKEFNKLIEGFEELNLTSDELYLIEKAKANILIRLCGINFAEKVYVPIYKPVSPYGLFYPYITNPTIDWTYTTDKTTIRPKKEM